MSLQSNGLRPQLVYDNPHSPKAVQRGKMYFRLSIASVAFALIMALLHFGWIPDDLHELGHWAGDVFFSTLFSGAVLFVISIPLFLKSQDLRKLIRIRSSIKP